jgi:hypothetical protein
MATEAQIEANRANAQKSTGPRTPEGKEKAAQNSLKHGLFTRETVIRGEDEGEFAEYRENLLNQLVPGTPLEETLAERVVDLSWRLKRAARDQEKAFVVLYQKHTAGAAGGTGLRVEGVPPSNRGPEALATCGQALPVDSNHRHGLAPAQAGDADATKRDLTIGWMIVADFNGEATLDRLLRYERRIESSMFRTLTELRRVHDQVQKAKQEVLETRARWKEEDWESKKTRWFANEAPRAGSEAVPRLTLAQLGSLPPLDLPLGAFGPTPAASGPMCKTNPIGGGGSSLQGGCTPLLRPRG